MTRADEPAAAEPMSDPDPELGAEVEGGGPGRERPAAEAVSEPSSTPVALPVIVPVAAPPKKRDLVAIVAALALAAGLAGLVAAFGERSSALAPRPSDRTAKKGFVRTGTPAVDRAHLPAAEPRTDEVVARMGERAVPQDVLRTATVTAAPWAPGLRLHRTTLRGIWEDRRAEIEDRTSGDVRAYAIGDLLPHGSLLVGISTSAADIMVGDTHIVRLLADGRIQALHDLTEVQTNAFKPARELDPDYEDKIRVALVDLRSSDPTQVQGAIDELIAAGDPGVELIISQVDNLLPVRAAEYAFPSGGDVHTRPRKIGVVVMLVLERITGQTFGDVAREDVTDAQLRAIAGAWRRWWGER